MAPRLMSLMSLTFIGASALFLLVCGCQQYGGPPVVINNYYGETPTPQPDLSCDGVAPDFTIDLFGVPGHTFYLGITDFQAYEMNQGQNDGHYSLYGDTYASAFCVTDAKTGSTASFGKVGAKIAGQSTWEPVENIPSWNIDTDEYTEGQKLDGESHLRLNNGQVNGLLPELTTLRIFQQLGYPAPETNYVWVTTNQWPDLENPGQMLKAPYTLVQRYKQEFCRDNFGDKCLGIWEGWGDITNSDWSSACELSSCDQERFDEIVTKLEETTPGAGYTSATEDAVDWDAWKTNQCITWFVDAWDSYQYDLNNVVPLLARDNRLMMMPYSTDFSLGSGGGGWYGESTLWGSSYLACQCQEDPDCRQKLLETCNTLVSQFEEIAIPTLDAAYKTLQKNGMERGPDATDYNNLKAWLQERPTDIRTFLADPYYENSMCVGGDGGQN